MKLYFLWRYVRDWETGNRYSPDFKIEPTYPEWEWLVDMICYDMQWQKKMNWNLPLSWAHLWWIDISDDTITPNVIEEISAFGSWVRVKLVDNATALQWIQAYTNYTVSAWVVTIREAYTDEIDWIEVPALLLDLN